MGGGGSTAQDLAMGTGFIGAAGSLSSAQDKANADNFNAQVNQIQAQQVEEQTTAEVNQQQMKANFQLGQERANYAAGGVNTSGSVLDVLQESAKNSALDALQLQHSGDMKAWAYQQGATLDTMKGDADTSAGNWAAASSVFQMGDKAFSAGAIG